MIELPRACIRADEIAELADFFSFGTNDLTQTALGFSRDDAEGKFLTHYLEDGVMERNPFEIARPERRRRPDADRGRAGPGGKADLKIGICGEHGGEPASVAFCHDLGLDYVSCSPFRVPFARLAAAQAALAEQGSRTSPPAADGDRRGRPALARHVAARVAGARRRGVACAVQRAHRPPLPPVSRRPRGPDDAAAYASWAFASEEAPVECRFGEPIVDGDRATCEYWAVVRSDGSEQTIAGVSVLRFDADGLVAFERDYWSVEIGRRDPPGDWNR